MREAYCYSIIGHTELIGNSAASYIVYACSAHCTAITFSYKDKTIVRKGYTNAMVIKVDVCSLIEYN